MNPANLTTGQTLRINGSQYTVASEGASCVSLIGRRGGESALVQTKRGDLVLLRNFREEAVASIEVAS